MPKYISQEAALSEACKGCSIDFPCDPCEPQDCEIKARLEDIPAADVEPVKRGRWVKANGSWITPGGDPVWECSECGKGRHVYGVEHGSYGSDIADGQWVSCPNCGCVMKEGGKEDVC